MRSSFDIAIIAVGCRFPGNANSVKDFWELLIKKVDAITDIPTNRWSKENFYDRDFQKRGKINSLQGGFLKDIDMFDASFFGISPREAETMDPQQRILLEVTHEAIEDGGLKLEDLNGSKAGVFIGISTHDYGDIQQAYCERVNIGSNTNTGAAFSIASNRISYVLNLKGPSLSVDTACSSSLMAVHLACQSLLNQEADIAFAGGVNLMIKPEMHIGFSKGGFLSSDSRCKSFDSRANGYVRSEGAGIIILKPLSQALEDGDKIYAVIKGSSTNQDGHTPNMTMPSMDSQISMLREAYKISGVSPNLVHYVEAHGTGTAVGDPIEAKAIGEVVGEGRHLENVCYIGSVKSNIGHLESASGIAGIIKLALVLKNRIIPANLHFQNPNPEIPFKNLKLQVPTDCIYLNEPVLYGGVNSFGFGGSNVHIVLQSPPELQVPVSQKTSFDGKNEQLFIWTVKDGNALKELACSYEKFISECDISLNDLSFSLLKKRSFYNNRLAVVAKDKEQLHQALQNFISETSSKRVISGKISSQESRIAFVYSGMGTQWWLMGRGLFNNEPLFREELIKIDSLLEKLGWLSNDPDHHKSFLEYGPLLNELLANEEHSRINWTEIAQPAITAVQIALTRYWKALGVSPDAIVGHSVGEVAAAYAAGIVDLEQAMRIIIARSQSLATARGLGKMLAVGQSEVQILEYINSFEGVDIAAVNGPFSVTLSGDESSLQAIAEQLQHKDIFHRFLIVEVPFHSHYLDPLKDIFYQALGLVLCYEEHTPLFSTVTGTQIRGKELNEDYWFKNLRQPVLFYQAIKALVSTGITTFIEIGPHPALSSSINEIMQELNVKGLVLPSLRRNEEDKMVMLTSLAQLVIDGFNNVNLSLLVPQESSFVSLPFYPWQKLRFWQESISSREVRIGKQVHPFLEGCTISVKEQENRLWKVNLDPRVHTYISEHRVQGPIVFPGAGHMELALAAAKFSFPDSSFYLEELEFQNPLFLPDEGNAPQILLEIISYEGSFSIYSKNQGDQGDWTLHSKGKINYLDDNTDAHKDSTLTLASLRKKLTSHFSMQKIYTYLDNRGLVLGTTFRCVEDVYTNGTENLAAITVAENVGDDFDCYFVHPTLLDNAFQVILAGLYTIKKEEMGIYIPYKVQRVEFYKKAEPQVYVYNTLRYLSENSILMDIIIFNKDDEVIAKLIGLEARFLKGSRQETKENHSRFFYNYEWLSLDYKISNVSLQGNHFQRIFLTGNPNNLIRKSLETVLRLRGFSTTFIDLNNEADMQLLLSSMSSADASISILYIPRKRHNNIKELKLKEQVEACQSFTQAVITLNKLKLKSPFWLLTQGVYGDSVDLEQAVLIGLARTTMNEYPLMPIKIVDFSSESTLEEIETFTEIVASSQIPEEIFIRGTTVFKNTLTHIDQANLIQSINQSVPASGSCYGVTSTNYKVIENLILQEFHEKEELENSEIKIDVKAAGLNFRDVMLASGLLSDEAIQGGLYGKNFGLECAGIVTAIDPNIKEFKIGDEVVAFAQNSLSGKVITYENYCVQKPHNISFEEAVSIPMAYLTAYVSLYYHARIEEGEKVLIHAGAGGVGIAAIRLALLANAEVFATVGTQKKEEFLRLLGVKYIYNSRTLDYCKDILETTNGQGVDVVLNSLSGKAIVQNIKCLRPFGRFIEIGKTDIYKDTRLSLKSFGKNLTYTVLDIDRMLVQKPEICNKFFKEIIRMVQEGLLPPHPLHIFPITQAKQAFSFMSRAHHIGKVVLSMKETSINISPPSSLTLPRNATYMITGGNSGFGLLVSSWMVKCGARNLVLLSRSGIQTEEALTTVHKMREQGANIQIINADINLPNETQKVIDDINNKMPPLKGIIHAAGVLDDKPLSHIDEVSFSKVLSPKFIGTLNLHLATDSLNLDFFICFSSVASVFGSVGQGNYAAANSFLDSFSYYRNSLGLFTSTINWGPLSETGMAVRNQKTKGILQSQGWTLLSSKKVLKVLEEAILFKIPRLIAADLDWNKAVSFFPAWQSSGRFAEVIRKKEKTEISRENMSLLEILTDLPEEQQLELLQNELKSYISKILGMDRGKIDETIPITNFGLDSLMSMQLVNWIATNLNTDYPMMKVMQGPTVIELTRQLLEGIKNNKKNQVLGTVIASQNYDAWIRRPKVKENAQLRLVCFNYGGGGATIFLPW